MSKLLQEAIADAKAVRAIAIENAKVSLEETFNREVAGLFHNKIKEELETEEGIDESLKSSGVGGKVNNTNPTPKKPTKQDKTKKEPQKYEKFFEETEEVAETVTPEGGPEGVDAKVGEEESGISSAELDEILAELENDLGDETAPQAPAVPQDPNAPVVPPQAPAAPVDATAVSPVAPVTPDAASAVPPVAPVASQDPNAPAAAPAVPQQEQPPVAEEELEEISLDELLKELGEESSLEEAKKDEEEDNDKEEDCKLKEENASLRSQLAEHVKVVEFLREQINEINLLNAKLLYTNKLFKKHGLTNEQKLKIVEKFDLASTIREVKYAYTILAESLNSGASTVKKTNTVVKNITEGLASKTVASTKPSKDVIVENTNEMASRFQKLAGIKK